jgi:hypothetical protein
MGNDAFWGIGLLEKVWYNVVRKVGNLSLPNARTVPLDVGGLPGGGEQRAEEEKK